MSSACGAAEVAGVPLDMAPLIGHLRNAVLGWQGALPSRAEQGACVSVDPFALARDAGLLPKGEGKPEVVLAGDVAVELGAPSTASHTAVLLTHRRELVAHGRVSRFGPDFDAVPQGASLPFAQIVILALCDGAWPDPFSLDSTQYLTHRLPGYMARSIPGRLWVRVSKAAVARGLTLTRVGAALLHTYLDSFPGICAAEVLFATSTELVASLAPVCLEAEIVAGRHRKLAISESGELDCEQLDCADCAEKPVCDGLREMLGQRRRTT